MGIYDDVANVEFIKKQTSKDKIFYLGYSQGTTQMFYSLVKKGKSVSDSLIKFVALAPCTYTNPTTSVPKDYKTGLMKMMDIGVYALAGPNWVSDQVTICTKLPVSTCTWTSSVYSNVQTESVQDAWYWLYNALQ